MQRFLSRLNVLDPLDVYDARLVAPLKYAASYTHDVTNNECGRRDSFVLGTHVAAVYAVVLCWLQELRTLYVHHCGPIID